MIVEITNLHVAKHITTRFVIEGKEFITDIAIGDPTEKELQNTLANTAVNILKAEAHQALGVDATEEQKAKAFDESKIEDLKAGFLAETKSVDLTVASVRADAVVGK